MRQVRADKSITEPQLLLRSTIAFFALVVLFGLEPKDKSIKYKHRLQHVLILECVEYQGNPYSLQQPNLLDDPQYHFLNSHQKYPTKYQFI